jgi:DNA-binding NarL/FixJ family response regulator
MEKHPIMPRSEKQKRILIVDDHPLVRFGLTMALAKDCHYVVCGEAVDHQEALAKIRELNPDLVTVDLTLNNSHGLELIKDIHVQFPTLLVLVISVHDEFLNARRVISAGAHGYMTKLEPLTQLVTAVERIFAGEVYVSHHVTSQMALQLAGRKRNYQVPEIHNLTDRELEIFELTGDGLNARQIALRLNLGTSTIETYRTRIKEKLCLRGHSAILQSAIRWNRSGSLHGNPTKEKQSPTLPQTLIEGSNHFMKGRG